MSSAKYNGEYHLMILECQKEVGVILRLLYEAILNRMGGRDHFSADDAHAFVEGYINPLLSLQQGAEGNIFALALSTLPRIDEPKDRLNVVVVLLELVGCLRMAPDLLVKHDCMEVCQALLRRAKDQVSTLTQRLSFYQETLAGG